MLARMDSNNKQTDEKRPASRDSFCQRKKSENGSFVSNLRNHFHEFIHASSDEHKRCLRNTIQKVNFCCGYMHQMRFLFMMFTLLWVINYILIETDIRCIKDFWEKWWQHKWRWVCTPSVIYKELKKAFSIPSSSVEC